MLNLTTLLLALLAIAVMCGAVSAASRRPAPVPNYYYFDGHGFVAGQPSDNRPYLALRDNELPVVVNRATKREAVALSPDHGALAGICYIQSSGGKIADSSGYLPCPRTVITISSGSRVVTTVQSDDNGYFTVVLVEGVYKIDTGAVWAEARVEKGKTVLVPLRAGKRMAD
jgi:hypothetical protein